MTSGNMLFHRTCCVVYCAFTQCADWRYTRFTCRRYCSNGPIWSPDPTQWAIWNNALAQNTVKQLPKFVETQHLEPFWKEKVTFFTSPNEQQILCPNQAAAPKRLRGSPPADQMPRVTQLTRVRDSARNKLVCRVHGSVPGVLMGSLSGGGRISS